MALTDDVKKVLAVLLDAGETPETWGAETIQAVAKSLGQSSAEANKFIEARIVQRGFAESKLQHDEVFRWKLTPLAISGLGREAKILLQAKVEGVAVISWERDSGGNLGFTKGQMERATLPLTPRELLSICTPTSTDGQQILQKLVAIVHACHQSPS